MYIWNIKALKKELAANTLTESQVFVYFLTMLTLDTLMFQLAPLFPNTGHTNVWDYVGYVGSVVFTVGGALVAYRMNGGSAGRDFLARYFSLMWVLTVRFLVFMLPFLVLAMIPMGYFFEALFGTEAAGEDFAALSMYAVMLSWAWFLVFYYRLAVHLRDVARAA
jgi:uncharacterized membrane-anchored protein YitT (DUF2179 family)